MKVRCNCGKEFTQLSRYHRSCGRCHKRAERDAVRMVHAPKKSVRPKKNLALGS